jgi:hypothetical protein
MRHRAVGALRKQMGPPSNRFQKMTDMGEGVERNPEAKVISSR